MAAEITALALLAGDGSGAFGGWAAGLSLFALAGLAWLFTYALHSTLLLCSAWIATRRMPSSRAGVRERVWKFALLGAFVTASLQVGLGFEPLGGRLMLRRATAKAERARPPETAVRVSEPVELASAAQPLAPLTLPVLLAQDAIARIVAGVSAPAGSPSALEPEAAPADTAPELAAGDEVDAPQLAGAAGSWSESDGWTRWAFATCVLGGLAGLFLFALLWVRLNGCLRDRVALEHGALAEKLAILCRRAGIRRRVRLSVAPSLGAPISMGMLRPEICVPPRVLLELCEEEQEVLLAHELAHIVRRDPLWLAGCRLCEGVFFFQPLNRMARREIEDCAEFLSDAWAVRHTGLRFSLANCLTRIAEWIVGDRRPLPAPAMAHGRSRLRHRVELLLDEHAAVDVDRLPGWLAPACFGFAAALIAVVPCVSAREVLAEPGDTGGLPFLPERGARWDARDGAEERGEPECTEAAPCDEPPCEPAAAAAPAADDFYALRLEMDALAAELPLLRGALAQLGQQPEYRRQVRELELEAQAIEQRASLVFQLAERIETLSQALRDEASAASCASKSLFPQATGSCSANAPHPITKNHEETKP